MTVRSAGRGGLAEIRTALSESRRLFASIGLFSVFVNILMLTGPLFILQVHDRVLTSRSEATLVALVAIVTFLFLMMGKRRAISQDLPPTSQIADQGSEAMGEMQT